MFEEHDVVRLRVRVREAPAGSTGTIISILPNRENPAVYVVEFPELESILDVEPKDLEKAG